MELFLLLYIGVLSRAGTPSSKCTVHKHLLINIDYFVAASTTASNISLKGSFNTIALSDVPYTRAQVSTVWSCDESTPPTTLFVCAERQIESGMSSVISKKISIERQQRL